MTSASGLIERTARAIKAATPPNYYMTDAEARVYARAALQAIGAEGLATDPPTQWIAPVGLTIGMLHAMEAAESSMGLLEDRSNEWDAARSAYLKEQSSK